MKTSTENNAIGAGCAVGLIIIFLLISLFG